MIYGNPSYESVQNIRNSILLKEWTRLGVFEELKRMPYPDESETRRELAHLVTLQAGVDAPRLTHIKRVDDSLYDVMSEFLSVYGVGVGAEEIHQQLSVYDPIIDYVKVVYNRPRPFQAAGAYGIPLYPLLESKTTGTASYPSGHTLLALWFRHFYMQSHPHLHKELMDFVLDVKLTREQGGVHYPSDGVFSMKVYSHLRPWMDAQKKVYMMGLDNITEY